MRVYESAHPPTYAPSLIRASASLVISPKGLSVYGTRKRRRSSPTDISPESSDLWGMRKGVYGNSMVREGG